MSVEFSAKISMLRKEKGVTQRLAADELGVSQALLSHYEKGIRECNLDFVKRAALYYGVSADYLLGLTESKRGFSDLFALEQLDTDEDLNPKTLLRALMFLSERAVRAGEAETHFFCDQLSLAAQKYSILLTGDETAKLPLNDLTVAALIENRRQERRKAQSLSEPTAAYRTVIKNADRLLDETVDLLTKQK